MRPSAKQPYKGGQRMEPIGLSNETNLAADRWGRGGNRSPFDPCPEGWKIPDVKGVALGNTDYGLIPFYKKI